MKQNLQRQTKSTNRVPVKALINLILSAAVVSLFYNNCSGGGGSSSTNSSFSVPAAPYCPFLPSKNFSTPVHFAGRAVYEYRIGGNGDIANGTRSITAVNLLGAQTYSVLLSQKNYHYVTTADSTAASIASSLAQTINADADARMLAEVHAGSLKLTPKDETENIEIVLSSNLKIAQGAPANPIRFAEVTIRDAAGTIVQCAETDEQGNFKFDLAQQISVYTVSVSPRANNSNLQAYVLQDPSSNQTYAVSAQFSASSSVANLKLIANASGTLEGGAFNILDQLARANIFLRNFTSANQGCGTTYADCKPFSVGPIVYAYWKKGFNPGTYEGLDPNSGISYYLPGKSQLFIMGGVNGDVNFSDTDHFDNSVIIHEYAHFMEDHYGKSDSPGGSHDGFSQLDPRLAWSEGWADFFQAAVTGDAFYRDTYGNPEGTAGLFFNEDIENLTSMSADVSYPVPFGEGNYHEFSITRLLWDAIDPHPVSGAGGVAPDENVQGPFVEIWSIFSGETAGFHSADQHFRSIGLFHLLQNSKATHTDWSSLRSNELQDADRRNYGASLTTNNCLVKSVSYLTPITSFDTNFFRNNRFISYQHSGGAIDILLNYSTLTGPLADLDLFLYEENYVKGEAKTIKASSQGSPPANCTSPTECSERIHLDDLAPGTYLINVEAASSNSGTTNFSLTINSHPGCLTN